ncbi:MAG: menaquinone biosynthesis protein [Planctomycetes bacterium]|nr:menaquinone biosynthesis protein [Planctomycetota bacterium]
MAPRIGSVPFLVGRPLVEPLAEHEEVLLEVPSLLIERLRRGELDVALASTIELFRTPGTACVRGPGIVAEERVMSVQLFSRVPFEEVRSLAWDPASRTGQALSHILLSERERPACRFLPLAVGEDPACADADAFLQIGDAALRYTLGAAPLPRGVQWNYDLATLWRERTGLPFVFAVWVVRPGAELGDLPQRLRAARDRGVERLESLVQRAARELALPIEGVRDYLMRACSWDLERPGVLDGLRLFGQKAAEHGLVPVRAELELLG